MRRRSERLWPFLLLALLFHYVEFTALPALKFWRAAPQDEFEIELVQEEAPEEAQPEPQKPSNEREEVKPEGQVVEIAKPREERHPDRARFVSEYDSRVVQETKAHETSSAAKAAATPAAPPSPLLAMRDRAEPTPPRTPAPPSSEEGLGQPAPTPSPGGGPDSAQSPAPIPTLRQLQPTSDQLERAIGTNAREYLPDVDESDETALNTKRWRFASFFNRVKRQVADNWHPEVAYRRRDPYGNVYGFRDRTTVLRVQLEPSGRLKDLFLDQASGVEFLDDEAVHAFRAAQPFPNPPRHLVDPETGLITFRFGFIFEVSETPTFRVFRYND